MLRLIGAVTSIATIIGGPAVSEVEAQVVDSDAVLIRALDRAFKPGFLSTTGVRKNADGTYSRLVTTGDAIAKPTFDKPVETARSACSEVGGNLTLALSAGRYDRDTPRTVLRAGEQRLDVDYSSLYELFAGFNSGWFGAGSSGFRRMFRTSYFAERAAKQADAAPPFGVFQCTSSKGIGLWAIAIMPSGEPFAYDLPIKVTPITQDWIREHHLQSAKRIEAERQAQIAADRLRQKEEDWAKAEAVRLRPFRKGLKVGSRTNCGIVIAVRDPLVQVQLSPYISGPSGIREFWVPREELTDATPPRGCGFGE
ncbi:hypothetical protein [Sphingomonas sp. 2378]|uniref:hypothetical protein n=1 Tax=Sphingomonas sp. 2378 TaxID=1219748 RepID=UPI00311B07AE